MAKTIPNEKSVSSFLAEIDDEKKRLETFTLVNLVQDYLQTEPKMWGGSIIGFGSYCYKYESGHEGTAPLIGLAARSSAITVYLDINFDVVEKLMAKLGKFKSGKGCLYIKRLEDINLQVFLQLIKLSIEEKTVYFKDKSSNIN